MQKLFDDYNYGKLNTEDIDMAISGAVPPDTGAIAAKGVASMKEAADVSGAGSSKGALNEALNKEISAFKKAIHALIGKGETDTAAKVLEQYAKVNPSDPDINIIYNIIHNR
jgi:hypothetical protein